MRSFVIDFANESRRISPNNGRAVFWRRKKGLHYFFRSNTVYPYLLALKYENEVTPGQEFFSHLPRGYDRDFSSFFELHTLFTCTLSPFPPAPGHRNMAAVLSPVSFTTNFAFASHICTLRRRRQPFARFKLPLKLYAFNLNPLSLVCYI